MGGRVVCDANFDILDKVIIFRSLLMSIIVEDEGGIGKDMEGVENEIVGR